MEEFDFFDTPIRPYTLLKDGEELAINIRNTHTMEQRAVLAIVATSRERLPNGEGAPLHVYGRLGERFPQQWYIRILDDLAEEALSTDHEHAQKHDIEQSLGADEKFKESRYRKKEK